MTDYLTLDDVRGLHADVMRRTGFLPAPVRDVDALESANMRPQMVAHCEGKEILDEKNRLHRRRQSHFYTQSRARSADLPGARR
jgi:hypothetical protein